MNQDQAQHYFLNHNADGVTAFHIDLCRDQAAPALSKLVFAKKYTISPASTLAQQWNALHIAAQYATEDTLKKLLANQLFAIDARDMQQRTPLHIAAMAGRLDVALALIDAGADTTLQDQAGFTAFQEDMQLQSLEKCYIKFSVADVRRLRSLFDAKRKSINGLPLLFPTRELPSPTQRHSTDLQQLIRTHNLTGDSTLVDTIRVSEQPIPLYGHFFWIGGAFENLDYRENILTCKTNFPELTITLWVDHPTDDVVQWCLTHQIALLSTELLLDSAFENLEHYLLDIHKGNPGAAVDHLRIECLDRFGGWYFDTDVQCIQPITSEEYAGSHTLIFFHKLDGGPVTNNCVIASKPQNKYLKILKKRVAKNYLCARFNAKSHILSGYDMRHKMTIETSGPGGLYPIVCMCLLGADPGVGIMNMRQFATSCDRNWIKPEKKFTHAGKTKAEALEAVQQLVNNIAHDLWFHSYTMYFDLYEPLFAKFPDYHLASFALYFMLSFYQAELKPVKILITFERLVREINYKNEFNNQDIIAYYKKDLHMVESEYKPIEGLKMQSYDILHEIDKERLFYEAATWKAIKEYILYNVDKTFADNATQMIAAHLLKDKRIFINKKLVEQLAAASQHQRLEQQRRAIIEVGNALVKHYNRTPVQ